MTLFADQTHAAAPTWIMGQSLPVKTCDIDTFERPHDCKVGVFNDPGRLGAVLIWPAAQMRLQDCLFVERICAVL